MSIDRSKLSTVAQGQAGVLRVASELILRGFRASLPVADDHGVDIYLSSGIRVQVKSSHLTFRKQYPNGAYWFQLRNGYMVSNKRTITKRGSRKFSDQVDFLVLFGITEGKFWIVPAEVLDNVQLVVVGPAVGYQQVDVERIKELYSQGMEQQEIANTLGTTQITISRRLRGIHAEPKRTCSSKVRGCENAWYLIHELELSRQPKGKLIEMPMAEAAGA